MLNDKIEKENRCKKKKKNHCQSGLTFHTHNLGHDIEITTSKNKKKIMKFNP
jgi:hypothetical protein